MALTGAWFADRSPGFGKALIDPAGQTGTVGLSPIIISGTSGTPPGPSAPPSWKPGTPLPDPGLTPPTPHTPPPDCNVVTSEINACGFDGYTYVHDLFPSDGQDNNAVTTQASLSYWVNFNTLISCTVVGASLQGAVFYMTTTNNNAGPSITGNRYVGCPRMFSLNDDVFPNSTQMTNGDFVKSPMTQAWQLPDTDNHWAHVMISMKRATGPVNTNFRNNTDPQSGDISLVQQTGATTIWVGSSGLATPITTKIYVNDTRIFDGLMWISSTDQGVGSGAARWSSWRLGARASDGFSLYIGSNAVAPSTFYTDTSLTIYPSLTGIDLSTGLGLKGALTEFWFDNKAFVDWSLPENRALFHGKEGTNRWYPVSLGLNGALPLGRAPAAYMTGSSTDFKYNRAMGNYQATAVVATGGTGLFDVSAPF